MFRIVMTSLGLAALFVSLAVPAWAQEAACPGGEACIDSFRWGAWGLIALGLLFLGVWLLPEPGRHEDEAGNAGLPLIRLLQARIEKEISGWRRWQWPVLGVFFLGLGIATLAGWR